MAAPVASDAVVAGSPLVQTRPVATVTGLRPSADPSGSDGLWVLTGVLLVSAVLVTASPSGYGVLRARRT